MRTPVSVAVAGLGSRGQGLVRAFDQLPAAELRWIFDQSRRPALRIKRRVPHAGVAASFDDLLADEALDAIAIATPAASRFQLAHRALEAGKHVLVESPLALRSDDAELLAARAGAGNLRLMVGNELPFHPGARRLRELVAGGRLGEVFYVCADRQGLGAHREEGVLWSAGAQAVALVLWLVGDEPIEASARGGSYGGGAAPDVAFCHLRFATGIEAELRLSCIEPRERRALTVVASRAMGILDELDAERALTLYERGSGDAGADALGGEAERGDIVSPRLPVADTVLARCEHFVTSVRSPADDEQDSSGEGPAVVAVLQALQRSLERGGAGEAIGTRSPPPLVADAPASAPVGAPAGVIRFPLRSG
jgi:predicted dehydrogenase